MAKVLKVDGKPVAMFAGRVNTRDYVATLELMAEDYRTLGADDVAAELDARVARMRKRAHVRAEIRDDNVLQMQDWGGLRW